MSSEAKGEHLHVWSRPRKTAGEQAFSAFNFACPLSAVAHSTFKRARKLNMETTRSTWSSGQGDTHENKSGDSETGDVAALVSTQALLAREHLHQSEHPGLTRRLKEASKSLLPDALFLGLLHKKCVGRFPSLRNPVTFNEQILQRNLRPDPRYAQLTDKLAARGYIERKLGREHLIPLVAVPSDFCREDYESLPDQFVMKANHGSSFVKIVRRKSETTFGELKCLAEKWLSTDFYRVDRERHYRGITPRLFFETLLLDRNGRIPADYKVHCFMGRHEQPVMYILVISDRFGDDTRGDVYDVSWKRTEIAIGQYKRSNRASPPPRNLDAVLKAATTLARDFEYVRVDLFVFDNRLYFGELTFTPGGGVLPFTPDRIDYEWGKLLSEARHQ